MQPVENLKIPVQITAAASLRPPISKVPSLEDVVAVRQVLDENRIEMNVDATAGRQIDAVSRGIAANLRVAPNEQRIGFDEAADKAGLPQLKMFRDNIIANALGKRASLDGVFESPFGYPETPHLPAQQLGNHCNGYTTGDPDTKDLRLSRQCPANGSANLLGQHELQDYRFSPAHLFRHRRCSGPR
ncbi:MAG: hypothetical protein R3C97_09275 [Geminicoccaceae bacterium]